MSDAEKYVLDTAVSLMREHGWCQGAYARKPDGYLCDPRDPGARLGLLGAILLAARDTPEPFYLYRQSTDCVREILGVKNLAEWEDDKSRRTSEVLDALELAALFAEENTPVWREPWIQ